MLKACQKLDKQQGNSELLIRLQESTQQAKQLFKGEKKPLNIKISTTTLNKLLL